MNKLIIVFSILLEVYFTGVAFAQDYPHVQYGSLARQYLDIYRASSTHPTPVYFDAHGNGGDISMPSSIVDSLKSHGISIVAWESLTKVETETEIQTGWDDAELMFSWVKANAATYNFDTTNFIIGGSSRGSILSWRYGQRPNPNIRGLYMYNALPSVWLDSIWWWPPNDVKVTAPPVFFVYLREPGCSTDPINPNIHDPNNGYKIMARYTSLGIGERDTLIHSLYKTTNLDKYQFLLNFALQVIKPYSPTDINPIVSNTSSFRVFPNPFSNQLTFTLSDNVQTTVSLYDLFGQQVLQQSFTNSTTIETGQLRYGIYYYQLRNVKSAIKNGKVLKQ
jgi:hypothetical protein